MIKFETLDIQGFDSAIHGMRHPLQSYSKADSYGTINETETDEEFIIGPNDYDLAKRLIKADSPEHAKFLRMINVGVDITADRGGWQEYATYKVGTTENSHSTMHTLTKTGIHEKDLNFPGGIDQDADAAMRDYLFAFNSILLRYNQENKEWKEKYFQLLKAMIPESFMQTRTCHLNYQVLRNMYRQRKNHRLPQGSIDFVSWIDTLPYNEFITGNGPEK